MKTITLTIPSLSSTSFATEAKLILKNLQRKLITQVHSFADYANISSPAVDESKSSRMQANFGNFFSKHKKNMRFIPIVVIGLVLMIAVGLFLKNSNKTVLGDKDQISIAKPDKYQEINKNFTFPVLDSEGKEAGKLQYTVESAELRNQLIIKGQEAKAIKGRTFLIITVKLKNDTQHAISVNTRDFIRLKIEGSSELLAPTIHNDPVEAQAISTLNTRVGFSLPEDQADKLSLQIGEIAKDKQTVELNFK